MGWGQVTLKLRHGKQVPEVSVTGRRRRRGSRTPRKGGWVQIMWALEARPRSVEFLLQRMRSYEASM